MIPLADCFNHSPTSPGLNYIARGATTTTTTTTTTAAAAAATTTTTTMIIIITTTTATTTATAATTTTAAGAAAAVTTVGVNSSTILGFRVECKQNMYVGGRYGTKFLDLELPKLERFSSSVFF